MHAAKATGKTGNLTLHYFTLVELLVVMTVISILMGLLLPVLKQARDSAQCVACLSNQKQLYLGLGAYIEDWKGALPTEGMDHPYGGAKQSFRRLRDGNYIDMSGEDFWCPVWRRMNRTWSPTISSLQRWAEYDYVILGGRPFASTGAPFRWVFYRCTRIVRPWMHILTSDSCNVTLDLNSGNIWGSSDFSPGIHPRHFGKSNRVFFDGHAKLLHYLHCQNEGYGKPPW